MIKKYNLKIIIKNIIQFIFPDKHKNITQNRHEKIIKNINISGRQRRELTAALIAAFPRKASLEQMLSFELDIRLDAITGGDDLREVVFNLVKIAEAENWIDNLISAARESNPGNSRLEAIADEILRSLHLDVIPTPLPAVPTPKKPITPDVTVYKSVGNLKYPSGCVAIGSPFYIERDGIEPLCYQTLKNPGSLIRIKAPKLMGKTSLLRRISAHAQEMQNYQVVYLDLGSVNEPVFTNLDRFLRWLCSKVCLELELTNKVDNNWNTNHLGSNDNCTSYFKKYVLKPINSPLVLCLDEVDRLFSYSELVQDFFGMLRSWHEKGKIYDIWHQLRLVLAHSTEVYIPLDYRQSPFNAGVPVELKDLNQQQVVDLAHRHGIDFTNAQLEELSRILGGHPHLLQLAMYHIVADKVTLEDLLQQATTEAGIYTNHLRSLLHSLRLEPNLIQDFKLVVNSNVGVELDSFQIYKLHSLGLVQLENNYVTPRCQLYRDYFRRVL